MKRKHQRIIILAAALLACLLLAPHIVRAASETITVDVTLDSNAPTYQACTPAANDCSLRGAISRANTNPGTNYTILVPAGTYTLTIPGTDEDENATGDLDIRASLTLQGAGMEATILQAGTLKGEGIDRVMDLRDDSTLAVQVEQLTIQHGEIKDNQSGGGILAQGSSSTLTLTQVKFKDNVGEGYSSGGGLASTVNTQVIDCLFIGNETGGEGGAVYHSTTSISFVRTTLMNNSAQYGGGFANQSTATMTNVTISGNTATGQGGGISQWNSGNLTLHYTTVANNTAPGASSASAIQNARSVYAYNSILSAPAGKQVCSGWLTGGSFSLGSDASCGPSAQTLDPLLGPLQNNRGAWTHALAIYSPAIDAADPANCIAEDQRKVARPIDGNGDGVAACDIGAFEGLVWVFLPAVQK